MAQLASVSKTVNFDWNHLKNAYLRVLVPKLDPPFVNYFNFTDDTIKKMGYNPGIIIQILEDVREALNLTYEYIYEEIDWKSYQNYGRNIFNSKNIDIIADGVSIETNEKIQTDFTDSFFFQYSGMMIRSPNRYNTWLIVTEPFSWEIWFFIVLSIIFSGIWFRIATLVLSKIQKDQSCDYLNSGWAFLSITVQQGVNRQLKSSTTRIVIGLWWLASMTLSASFTGSLVALFSVERDSLPFKTLQSMVDVIKTGKYTILMSKDDKWQADLISKSSIPEFKTLWREMSFNHKLLYVDDLQQGIEKLKQNPRFILFGPYEVLSIFASIECEIVMLEEQILPVYLAIPMRQNSPYTSYFSKRIKQYKEFGLISKWFDDYKAYVSSRQRYQCNMTSYFHSTQGFLTLSQTQGGFWILIIGLCLGILYLIMEYLTCFGTALMSVHMKTRNNSQIRSDVKLATFSVNSNEPRQPISTILLDEVTNK